MVGMYLKRRYGPDQVMIAHLFASESTLRQARHPRPCGDPRGAPRVDARAALPAGPPHGAAPVASGSRRLASCSASRRSTRRSAMPTTPCSSLRCVAGGSVPVTGQPARGRPATLWPAQTQRMQRPAQCASSMMGWSHRERTTDSATVHLPGTGPRRHAAARRRLRGAPAAATDRASVLRPSGAAVYHRRSACSRPALRRAAPIGSCGISLRSRIGRPRRAFVSPPRKRNGTSTIVARRRNGSKRCGRSEPTSTSPTSKRRHG